MLLSLRTIQREAVLKSTSPFKSYSWSFSKASLESWVQNIGVVQSPLVRATHLSIQKHPFLWLDVPNQGSSVDLLLVPWPFPLPSHWPALEAARHIETTYNHQRFFYSQKILIPSFLLVLGVSD